VHVLAFLPRCLRSRDPTLPVPSTAPAPHRMGHQIGLRETMRAGVLIYALFLGSGSTESESGTYSLKVLNREGFRARRAPTTFQGGRAAHARDQGVGWGGGWGGWGGGAHGGTQDAGDVMRSLGCVPVSQMSSLYSCPPTSTFLIL
jgi:hypothetical protein